MFRYTRLCQLLLLLGFGLLVLAPLSASAQTITQSYTSDQPLRKGMIVRLKDNGGKRIEALTQKNERDMLGVVVVSGDSPVALTDPTATSAQYFVATTGQYDVLVSSQNGGIKIGDFITISALNGVGMKMDGNHQVVIGKALEAFDGNKNSEGKATVDRGLIGKQSVTLSHIMVDISVAHNPFYKDPSIDGVPPFLAKAARMITSKPVSALRIYGSVAIILVCIIVATVIIYSSVRSAMVAVGRNPLAKKTVIRSLIQVMIITLIIFTIGLIAVYLLLKL